MIVGLRNLIFFFNHASPINRPRRLVLIIVLDILRTDIFYVRKTIGKSI